MTNYEGIDKIACEILRIRSTRKGEGLSTPIPQSEIKTIVRIVNP